MTVSPRFGVRAPRRTIVSWRSGEKFGHQLLLDLVKTLNVDVRWIEDTQDGFVWWAADHAQHVWCEEGVFQHATTTYRMHCETDVIRGRGHAADFELALEREMDHTTLNALVYDIKDDTYRLHSSVFATEENMPVLRRTAYAAVILQVIEGQTLARKLQQNLGATPATSAHPTMGLRTQPDPMTSAIPAYFAPLGQQPSKWQGVAEWLYTERAMEREAEKFVSDHQTHLQAEFLWHASPSQRGIVLDVTAREPHPLLGNGLHFTLTVPLVMSPERVSHMALELNQYERENWKRSHMLGSWSCHDGMLAFRAFVPNVLYRPELLEMLSLSMAVRAHWVDEFFVEKRKQADAHRAGV